MERDITDARPPTVNLTGYDDDSDDDKKVADGEPPGGDRRGNIGRRGSRTGRVVVEWPRHDVFLGAVGLAAVVVGI